MVKSAESAEIIPSALATLRAISRVSLRLASEALDVPQSTILDWEEGVTKPTLSAIRQLSEVYRKPLAAFYMGNEHLLEAFEQSIVNLRSLGSRDPNGDLSESAVDEWNRLIEKRTALHTLLDMGEIEPYAQPLFRHSKNPNKLARELTKWLEIKYPRPFVGGSDYDAFNYFRGVIESRNIWVLQTDGVDLDDFRGAASSDPSLPIILVNMSDHCRARSFTLFHELAHIIRHETAMCELGSYYSMDEHCPKEESFCNAVAAEMLVPEANLVTHDIVQEIQNKCTDYKSVKQLSNAFGSSIHCMLIRLKELSIISNDNFVGLLAELRGASPTREAGGSYYTTVAARLGRKFASAVFMAMDKRTITRSAASSMLAVKTNYIERLRNHMGFPSGVGQS